MVNIYKYYQSAYTTIPLRFAFFFSHDLFMQERGWEDYEEIDDGRYNNSSVSPCISIGKKSSNQWHHRRHSYPIINILRRSFKILIQHFGQVGDEICNKSKIAHPLAKLHCCNKTQINAKL